jgi:hypothetical protein
LAKDNGLTIEFIRTKTFRKEERIKKILKERGSHPGLVHIFSAMEPCTSYQPWHDKSTGKTFLRYDQAKCMHYYFYFVDEKLGLCYLRLPTWCPFRLQFYFNGHSLLAALLTQKGIGFEQRENAFLDIADFPLANRIAERMDLRKIHAKLDRIAQQFCPVVKALGLEYHWSLMQVEYSTDIIFKKREDLQAIYPHLLETLIHSVKPENIATFLGHKLNGNYKGEVGNNLDVRILGTRIKHRMGPVCIKMYDKFGIILRIEVTVNDVSFFQQYRPVRSRDGNTESKWTKMKKNLYSLKPLVELLRAANLRYLQFLSQIETPEVGSKILDQFTSSKKENNHSYKGFNFFALEDSTLLRMLLRGEFAISGFSNKLLKGLLPGKNTGQVGRLLKRLRVHRLIKRVGTRYKYYLTRLGMHIVSTALKLRELFVIPQLSLTPALRKASKDAKKINPSGLASLR